MLILALSTSGRAASAALIKDGAAICEKLSDAGLTHSETIMPLVDRLMCETGAGFGDIDFFASDVGPGSFTGVRIGVCICNAFAYAAGKPVVGVSSLEALALSASTERSVCALIDARNGNGYAALYDGAKETLAPSPVVVSELLPTVPPGTLFTGDGALIYGELITQCVPEAQFADGSARLLRASMLALPAMRAVSEGRIMPEAMPLYLRPTQAERLYKEKK